LRFQPRPVADLSPRYLPEWAVDRSKTREGKAAYNHDVEFMINRLDGLQEERLVPRIFHSGPEGMAQQLSLSEVDVE
jgi:hypothetical protein